MNKRYMLMVVVLLLIAITGWGFWKKSNNNNTSVSSYISTNVSGLPEVKPTETVELKNGDTYNITASYVKKDINGIEYKMLAYNGSIPGPLLKIPQGAEITINFKNDTDIKTLLHSHGVRMDNAFDGSQTSQKEMKPGESFSYKLKFPDAGVFWYHPHVREDYEQELGLYGNFIVTPTESTYWSPVNREVSIFLDDIAIDSGKINLSNASADHTLMGRYGNVMLTNGVTSYTQIVQKGEVVRFYVTNAANARPYKFAIKDVKMKLVGGDSGAYEKDQWIDTVTLAPSERAIVEVLFQNPGNYELQNQTPNKIYGLGAIVVIDNSAATSYVEDFNQLKTHTGTTASIDPLRQYFDKVPDKQLNLTLDMGGNMMNMQGMGHGTHKMPNGQMMGGSMMMSDSPDGIEWEDTNQMMNQMANTDSVKWKLVDQATGKENMDINWGFKKDEPVKIRIYNDPNSMHPMQHPIHFHGQQFLVLSRNGKEETDLAWKDTTLVPSGQTVDILLYPTNPGTWMAHCHIAEHLEAGMMLKYTVK